MILLLPFILTQLVFAQDLESELAQSKEWKRLLHYKHNMLFVEKSQVDGPYFFLSPNGKKDPEAELRATIDLMKRGGGEIGRLKQPVHCAFPARKRFLEKALSVKFPGGPCPKWDEFLQRLDPVGVSMVYATAYANNPASMFGHSFLKIRAKKNESSSGQLSLLDWSLNYAAQVPSDENGFAFAWFGLTGGYQGQFATVPFYAKIEEYGYLESRDIWEYDLNLSQVETMRLLEAIWEIETNSYFDYYFFDENCSYQILTMLEIVKPEWEISNYFMSMIPGESVKRIVNAPGAVREVRMRPSLERRLKAAADQFSAPELDAWYSVQKGGSLNGASAGVLDAYLLYLQSEKQKHKEIWSKEEESRLREGLILRSKQKVGSKVLSYGGEKTRPDLGHGPYSLGLGPSFTREQKNGIELAVSFAYHGILDADPGYTPHTEVLFPNFKFRYFFDKKFALDEANFFSIASLNTWSVVRKPMAWRATGSYQRLKDLDCDRCRGLSVLGGYGPAWSVVPERWTLWAMANIRGDAATVLHNKFRFLYGPEFGSLATLHTESKILLVLRPVWGGDFRFWQLDAGISHPLSRSLSMRTEFEWFIRRDKTKVDGKILAVHYF